MEKLDLYTIDRIPTGKTHTRGKKLPPKTYRSVVHVVIFNSQNQMLIQQRASNKRTWANLWDISVGGSCIAGENSRQSAERETLEELGIKHDFSNERPYVTFNFEHGFDDYYIIQKDIEISSLTLQKEEVQNAKWASQNEILEMLDNKQFINYYKTFILSLFEMRKHRGVIDDFDDIMSTN